MLTARGVAVAMAGYYPIDTDHTGDKHKGNNAQARIHGFKRFTRGAVPRAPLFRAEHILFLTLKQRTWTLNDTLGSGKIMCHRHAIGSGMAASYGIDMHYDRAFV